MSRSDHSLSIAAPHSGSLDGLQKGALALAASQDWRLALPFVAWGVAYGVMLWQIVPRLGRVAQEQADARSAMTGIAPMRLRAPVPCRWA